MTSQHDPSTRRPFARPAAYLMVAVAATAANLALFAVGVQYTIATGMLVGASCAGVVCWHQTLAEDRMTRRLVQLGDSVATQRVVYLPQQSKGEPARRLETPGVGLTPEAIAAARALAQRIAIAEASGRDAR